MKKLLMVCMGNICRSPMAHSVAHHLALRSGKAAAFEFDSAGTHAYHVGEAPDARTEATLRRHGYPNIPIHSRKITPHDFSHFDHILAMDAQNLADLKRMCPAVHQSKLNLFLSFADGLKVSEVPDPYYGNIEGFERVFELCEAGADAVLRRLS